MFPFSLAAGCLTSAALRATAVASAFATWKDKHAVIKHEELTPRNGLPPETQMQPALNSQGAPFGPHLHPLPHLHDSVPSERTKQERRHVILKARDLNSTIFLKSAKQNSKDRKWSTYFGNTLLAWWCWWQGCLTSSMSSGFMFLTTVVFICKRLSSRWEPE